MTATKHIATRCTVCRDYVNHEKAQRGPGNWVAKLGTIHMARRIGSRHFICGRLRRRGMIWALQGSLVTCRSCRRAAR